MDLLPDSLAYSHWWILGVVLVILEVLLPSFFFLWLGFAAGVVGVLVLFFPEMGWKGQVLWFSGVSVASVGAWHGFLKKHPTPTDRPTLNRRGSRYVGRTFILTRAIVNGRGRVRVDDTSWQVAGPDAPEGASVKVTKVDGTVLWVEPLTPRET